MEKLCTLGGSGNPSNEVVMRVLVACEFSGVVRDAFAALGHDAWSCDLLPSERPGNHIQGNVLDVLDQGWDLMVGHPPCKYLSYAAAHCWDEPGRAEKREAALKFFMDLYNAPIPFVAIENPHGYPRIAFRQPDQEIYPYYFGDPYVKKILLWLRGLKPLQYRLHDDLFGERTATDKPAPDFIRKDGNKHYHMSKVRSMKSRSRFFPAIAAAMADQWGNHPLTPNADRG